MKLLRPKPNNFCRLNLALPVLLIFSAQKICAQLAPPDDFFNRGAQLYISNNIPAAKEQVETGLKFYPDDEKLKKLEELLKQQQQNQQSQSQQNQSQNQNSSQQQKNQQNQNQQNQSQQNQQQSQSQQQKNSQEQQAKNQEQKNEEQKQQEQKAAAEKASGQTNENQNAGQEVVAAQMTPEEAKRLLDSQKGDEQFLQLKPQGKPEDSQRKIKDW